MKLISLISGGIDSPVATYLMLKKGIDIVAVHMDNRPFTDDKTIGKFLKLIGHLEKISNKKNFLSGNFCAQSESILSDSGRKIKTYIVPHGNAQMEFAKNCMRKLHCLLCRRMMYRVAEEIAGIEGADAVITGESMGQVASQTLINIEVESRAIKIPVLRPLIGFDKEDTIRIAREIGTYEISTMPGLCCTIVPKMPATQARLEEVLAEESKVNINSILKDLIKNSNVNLLNPNLPDGKLGPIRASGSDSGG